MLMQRALYTGLLTLGLTSTVFAQNWGAGSGGVDPQARAAAAARIADPSWPVMALLAKPVERVDWEDITFDEIMQWLADEGERKVNIVPRWESLTQIGIDEDKTIKGLTLYNTTVGEVLQEVLFQLSATGGGQVTFRGERNTLRISTASDFNSELILRVYDVTDVLFRVPDFSESAPQIDLSRQTNTGGGGGGGSQPIFRGAGGQSQEELSEEGDQDPEEILNDLVKLIEDTIDPLNWDTNNQGPHRVRGYGRRSLVVYAPASIHEQITGFFARHR